MKRIILSMASLVILVSWCDLVISQTPTGNVPGHYSTVDNGNGTFTITIQPDAAFGKDTHIADERLDGNGGQFDQFDWQMGGTLPAGSGSGRLGALLIRFEVSAIPSQANILSAEASLYKHQIFNLGCPSGVIFQRNVYRLLTDWDEGPCNTFAEGPCLNDASWNRPKNGAPLWNGTRPATDSDPVPPSDRDYDATPLSTNTSEALGFMTWNVINAVKGWVEGSFVNYGLVFRNPSYVQLQCPSAARFERYWSSDYSVPSLRPKLVITYSLPPVNRAPAAKCKEVTVSAGGSCTANASIDDGSFDPDGDPITLDQSPVGPYSLGTTSVTLTVTDDKGASAQCAATVTVVDDTPPTLTCPANLTVNNDPGECSAVVSFSVSASDNCDSEVSVVCTPASGSAFPLGTTTVNCTATDDDGNQASCSFTVTVKDNEAPAITPAAPTSLWPPNHKYVTFTASQCVVAISDNCAGLSASDVVITQVTSDEPEDATGGGDGNTLNDIVIASDCKSVQLRSERQGSGNGRVYTIHLSVSDGNGNSGAATCIVTVPKSQNGNPAVDDGPSGYQASCGVPKLAGNNFTPETLPEGYALEQNHPNPFNPETEIRFQLPQASHVVLRIYNTLGEEIRTLADGQYAAGYHRVRWDGKNRNGNPVPSGIYFYQFRAATFSQVKKMNLLR